MVRSVHDERWGEPTMEQSDRRWTVSCAACEIVIGHVDGGRFVHQPECLEPLAIRRGTMRCCRCGGGLTVMEDPVEAVEPDEPLSIHQRTEERAAIRAREARQRG